MEVTEVRYNVKNFAVIILAAGRSSRLGEPKQLLAYRDKNLLQHAIDSAKQINSLQVIVVLGSNRELITNKIDGDDILIIENASWESGIASSIKAGINALKNAAPDVDAIILMVCDQPFADAEILNKLILKQVESKKAIVGCSYDGTQGTPALFHSSLFPELLSLEGDSGAKKLFETYKGTASFVSFNDGGIDIDTTEDYKNLPK